MKSEADVLNDIEERVRQGKKVKPREINLLLLGYDGFGAPIPDDISKILGLDDEVEE